MARLLGGSGRIKPTPAEIAQAALAAADRRRAARAPGAAGVQQLIGEMARFMIDRRIANDSCDKADLKREGFSDAEIAKYGERAAERARRIAPALHAA